MALFIDVHNHIPGLTERSRRRRTSEGSRDCRREHDVKYLQYWYNEAEWDKSSVSIEAPE